MIAKASLAVGTLLIIAALVLVDIWLIGRLQ